ncbi:hypothetical protein [Roseovarius Plymouth podovirus 1]|uniref:Uncharacterized protein n=2 Tax=Roseovarius Plymouth podovirus 1 TaxID=926474 RepID=K4Q4Z5_9CAUD|nr:hypothetical protein HYO70_gp88 [Roseovarius Plymouth podovirus 1]CBW47081.1 hypothetical protein [Roseovarius sp. 217 phage 1]CBX88016.1 hypothetical protein [Roseovarius Plymouth podovirus 1]
MSTGIFASLRAVIVEPLMFVAETAETARDAVSVAHTWVDNRVEVFEDEDMIIVATASAKRQAELKRELEADAEATKIYNGLKKKIEKRRNQRQARYG